MILVWAPKWAPPSVNVYLRPKVDIDGTRNQCSNLYTVMLKKGHAVDKVLVFAAMSIVRQNCTRPISVLLAIILLAAQAGALAHAYEHEHDPAHPQTQVCSACIAGQAVGSACVNSTPQFEIRAYKSVVGFDQVSALNSVHVPLARQRAPPTPI